MMDLKKLLQGDTGGMSEQELIEASRGTYFEKFVDQLLQQKAAQQKARESAMAQQMMQQLLKKPTVPGMSPIQNAPPDTGGGLRQLFPGGVGQTAPAGGVLKSPYRR